MGSAEGRRKCCEFYWYRGYLMGYAGKEIWFGAEKSLTALTQKERFYFAGTTSASLSGLFLNGYKMGRQDCLDKIPARTQVSGYDDYRKEKDAKKS